MKAIPLVSPLVLLGASATVLSTVTLLPHVAHAFRTRRPGGSTFGWTTGAISSTLWVVYGLVVGDLVVAAPGLITVPAGFTLAIWCALDARKAARAVQPIEKVLAWEQSPAIA